MFEVAALEIKGLGCPASLSEVRQWANSVKGPRDIRRCNELLKLDRDLFKHNEANSEKRAIDELLAHELQRKDSLEVGLPKLRVWDAISLHKTLGKMKFGEEFKKVSQEMFPYSTYFHDK